MLVASSLAVLAPVPMLTPAAEAAEPSAPLQATVDAYVARAQTVTWEPCEGLLFQPRSSCATVIVPRDWKNPAAGTLRLAVSYLRASGTSKGLLTSNPGGPGAEGLLFTEALSRSKPKLHQEYDLLGFDPRGFGASTNIRCLTTKTKLERLPKVADRRVRNRATHSMEVAEAKLFGEACAADPLARYINTQQTVWDVDFLRQLMAKRYNKGALYDKLDYIGYSYGTWLGAWYADTFPARVGKFVLDSNMQWTTSMYANQALDSKSFQRRRDKMFFPYAARHHRDFGLGKSTSKVKKKYESIRKGLAKQAARDLKKGRSATFGPEDLDFVLSSLLYSNEMFPAAGYITELAGDYAKKPSSSKYRKALAKRVKAPMTKAPFVVQRSASKVKGSALVSVDLAGTIVRCNDSATPGNLTQLLKRADSDAKKYPFTGYLNTVQLCAYWKFKPQTRTIDLASPQNKMLMFQSEGDPATAYEGALAAHRRTAGKTVMVSVDNEGQHGLYIDGPSTCLERIGDTFLFSARPTLPARDTRCTTSPLPDDKKVYTLSGPVSGAKSDAKKAIKAKNSTVKAVRADVAKRGLS